MRSYTSSKTAEHSIVHAPQTQQPHPGLSESEVALLNDLRMAIGSGNREALSPLLSRITPALAAVVHEDEDLRAATTLDVAPTCESTGLDATGVLEDAWDMGCALTDNVLQIGEDLFGDLGEDVLDPLLDATELDEFFDLWSGEETEETPATEPPLSGGGAPHRDVDQGRKQAREGRETQRDRSSGRRRGNRAPSSGGSSPAETPLLNQRDNDFVNGSNGDSQCQTTAITMVLLSELGGEQAVIDKSHELVKTIPVQYDQAEEMVDYVAEQYGFSQTGGATAGGLLELYTGSGGVKIEDTAWQEDWENNEAKLRVPSRTPFVASTDTTSSGHVVTILEVRSDGVVLHDPYGVNLGTQNSYVRHGEGAAGVALPDWRYSHNPDMARAFAAGEVRSDWGESNFFTWEEVEGPLNIGKWVQDPDKEIDDVRG